VVPGPDQRTACQTISPELRSELLEQADPEILAESELEQAAGQYGSEWLDQEEARAAGAAAVCLPGDQLLELLAIARNGLRPKVAN
jgi:hypothetical protein